MAGMVARLWGPGTPGALPEAFGQVFGFWLSDRGKDDFVFANARQAHFAQQDWEPALRRIDAIMEVKRTQKRPAMSSALISARASNTESSASGTR